MIPRVFQVGSIPFPGKGRWRRWRQGVSVNPCMGNCLHSGGLWCSCGDSGDGGGRRAVMECSPVPCIFSGIMVPADEFLGIQVIPIGGWAEN